MAPTIDHELLLSQTGWLRRLAVELAGPERAEDVLQETWLAAIRRPPRALDEPGLRAWLAAVVRNLARLGHRGEAHRMERERARARSEVLPSVEDSVLRAARQKALMDAVMSLEPGQRDVVVLRYFDDLPPRAIAERLGLGAAGVDIAFRNGALRVAPHLYNTPADIDRALSVLDSFASSD